MCLHDFEIQSSVYHGLLKQETNEPSYASCNMNKYIDIFQYVGADARYNWYRLILIYSFVEKKLR
jgi:hypothetical protein